MPISTMTTTCAPTAMSLKKSKEQERRVRFDDAYQVIRKDLLDHVRKIGMPSDVVEWYGRVRIVSLFTPS